MNQKSARTLLTPAVAQSVSKQGREYRVTSVGGGGGGGGVSVPSWATPSHPPPHM